MIVRTGRSGLGIIRGECAGLLGQIPGKRPTEIYFRPSNQMVRTGPAHNLQASYWKIVVRRSYLANGDKNPATGC